MSTSPSGYICKAIEGFSIFSILLSAWASAIPPSVINLKIIRESFQNTKNKYEKIKIIL